MMRVTIRTIWFSLMLLFFSVLAANYSFACNGGGGSWSDNASASRSADSNGSDPAYGYEDVGFRLVLILNQ